MVIVPALTESSDADAVAVGGANGAATKIRVSFTDFRSHRFTI